jgi:hypothetical protein
MDPSTGAVPFDEYWTNSYSAFHDALSDKLSGNWVNQHTLLQDRLPCPHGSLKISTMHFLPLIPSVDVESLLAFLRRELISATSQEPVALALNHITRLMMAVLSVAAPGMVVASAEPFTTPVTNVSYKFNGVCTDAWPTGNTLSDFVTVYRGSSAGGVSSFVLSVGRAGTGTGTVSSSPAGISCGASCSSSLTSGTVVTLTASPAAGSTFAGWSGAGCAGTGACSVTMNAAQSVTATFNNVLFSLTVTLAGTGTGSVISSPAGISCAGTCGNSFNAGTTVC